MDDPLIGRRLGDFTLREVIGAGASGVIYRAEQPLLQREAAVKVLAAAGPEAIAGFLKEARLASGLDHPYAAHIYGFGAEPDHVLWCAMELVRGATLDRWIADRGPMAAERFLPLLERICEVVQSAHDRGIVHRDLKPANVMVVSRAGRLLPKLLDFGIARLALAEPPRRAQTSDPVDENPVLSALPAELRHDITHKGLVGSPGFMAPEQWLDPSKADARTDQYALGVLCFVVLTGELPFRGRSLVELGRLHATAPVPPLPDRVPRALHAVIARATAKRPEERFADLLALAAAFREALDLPAEAEALPQLDEGLRDGLALTAPQPIAESITALEAARDLAQARKAADGVLEVTAHYAALVALAGLSHVPEARRPPRDQLATRLAPLATGRLDAAGWLELACAIAAGFRDDPTVFPIPELVTTLGDPALPRPPAGGELAPFLGELARLLGKLAWVSDYRIACVRRRALEAWAGTRRTQRAVGHAPKDASDGAVLLLDGDGAAVLTLSPLVQVARPSPGLAEEMFLFDGADRRGPHLRAIPVGFDRRDPDLADWLRTSGLPIDGLSGREAAEERPPYRGLATFTPDDAGWFFGREREVEAFVNRMRVDALLAVVGPSGAGKSSFVQAGVLPCLPEGTRALTVRPGASPLAELSARLARADIAVAPEQLAGDPAALARALEADVAARGGAIVLVVDQFEELFTLGAPTAERRAYSEALAGAGGGDTPGVRVILTLRDDFLVRSEQLPALRQRLAPGMELLTTPAAEDLERILVEPARRVGYHFDDDALVAEMVHAVAEQPGALPLLSFTASRLWELRDVRFHALTRRAYQTLGGVGGALAKHAEETLASLPGDQQPLVREIFRHLVTSQGTRAVLSRGEAMELLGGGERAEGVLERLVGSRLVVASEGDAGHERIEVAHEALISAWPRLVRWRQEDAEIVRLRDQLRATARQWAERGRPQGLLWRDEVLAEYRLWRTRYTGALTDLEEEFGRRCLDEADRAHRRRRVLLGSAFAVLAAAAVAMAVLGLRASHSATRAKQLLVDSYFEQARTAVLEGRNAQALHYIHLLHASGADSPALRLMYSYARPSVSSELARLHDATARVLAMVFAPDSKRLYAASEDGAIRVWDTATYHLIATWRGGKAPVRQLAITPDGQLLASASDDGTLRVWDTAAGRAIASGPGQSGSTYCLALVPTRGLVVTAGAGSIRISDLRSARTIRDIEFDGLALACAVDPQARWVALGDRTTDLATLWDLDTGARLLSLPHEGAVASVRFSPDGHELATASWDGSVREWSVPDGALVHAMAGHGAQVDRVVFSPDGKQLVSIGHDNTARVWDAATGAAIATLRGHARQIYGVAFDATGRRVLTYGQDGTARLWDASSGRAIAILIASDRQILVGALSPDGKLVAGTDHDTIVLWPARDPFAVEMVEGDEEPCSNGNKPFEDVMMAECPHLTRIVDVRTHRTIDLPASQAAALAEDRAHAALAAGRTVTTWDITSKREQHHIEAPAAVNAVAWHRADAIAIGTDSGDVLLWHVNASEPPVQLDRHEAPVVAVAWNDAGLLVTGDARGEVHLSHPLAPARDRQQVSLGSAIGLVMFSPDGSVLALASGRTIELRDGFTGALRARLDHPSGIVDFSFDAAGDRLISGATDSIARIWRTRDGKLLVTLPGSSLTVTSPTFVGSSLVMASGGDGGIHFWDTRRAQEILVVPGTNRFGDYVAATGPGELSLIDDRATLWRWHIPLADPR